MDTIKINGKLAMVVMSPQGYVEVRQGGKTPIRITMTNKTRKSFEKNKGMWETQMNSMRDLAIARARKEWE